MKDTFSTDFYELVIPDKLYFSDIVHVGMLKAVRYL